MSALTRLVESELSKLSEKEREILKDKLKKQKESFENKISEIVREEYDSLTEGKPMPTDTPNEFAYSDFKKWAYKKRSKIKKQMASLGSQDRKERAIIFVWELWDKKNKGAYSNIKNIKKFGKVLYDMMKKDKLVEGKLTEAKLKKSDVSYQVKNDYSGNTPPKVTKLNNKELSIWYGYKTNPKDTIDSFNKLYPSMTLKHVKWSSISTGGGVHSFKITESVNEIKKGDYVDDGGEIGLVNKVKGQAAYVKFDSNPRSFHPVQVSALKKKSQKHKGKDCYLLEGKAEDATVEKAIVAMVDSMIKAGKKPGEITKHLKSQVPYKITTNAIRKLINRKEIKPGEWLNESMIGIKTKANFKPLQLKGALERAKIKGFQMNRLSVTLTALKLDKKYYKEAMKIIDGLGLSVMMAKESKLNESSVKDLQKAKKGAKASGGGYGPFLKIKGDSWKNLKSGTFYHSRALASHIGGFNDFQINENKLTEISKEEKAAQFKFKLFLKKGLRLSVKDGEDKLYNYAQELDRLADDEYDEVVDPLFMAVELVQDAGEPGKNNVVKDKEYYSYIKSAQKHINTFQKNAKKAIKGMKEGVNEARMKKVDKNMWRKFSDDKRFDALLSVVKDPDEAEKYINAKWNDLPSGFERDMTIYESKLNEMDINDPILIAVRARATMLKKAKAAPKVKKISTAQYYKLMDKEIDLINQIKDATKEYEQLDSDMNAEAGQKGDSWSDADANRYGGDLDKLQTKVEKLAKEKLAVKKAIMNYRIN